MLQTIRNIIFWTVDYSTGNKKRNHLQDITAILSTDSIAVSSQKKQRYLQQLLTHAIQTVSYYSGMTPTLTELPVTNKNLIRTNFEQFESNTYKNKPKIKVATSGSTGTPFQTYQNNNKSIRNTADTLYFWKKATFSVGNKLYFFRLWKAFERKSPLTQLLQNIVPVDVFDLTDAYIKTLITDIQNSNEKTCLLGYVSAFEKIARYLDRVMPDYRINSVTAVITISEKLDPYTKKAIKKYFGVAPISRYSNIENGIIAQQPTGKSHFEINEASYHVEILDITTDQPVPYGTLGRIVVTDLFNYAVPMIRYDTGDLGVMEIVKNKKTLTHIEGRQIDTIYNTAGEIIRFNLVFIINKYPELHQCQIIQEDIYTYTLKLNHPTPYHREQELIEELKIYIGADAIITPSYTDEIPLLASGKRRFMVNNMTRQKATLKNTEATTVLQ